MGMGRYRNRCGYKMSNPCGDGTALYLDRSSEHMNLHVTKLYRTKHRHTDIQIKLEI